MIPSERTLFDDLFKALDCLVLERSKDNHAFRLLHDLPEWARCVIGPVPNRPSQTLWIETSPFLKHYMVEAEDWWNRHENGETEPVPWEEDWPGHPSLDLEATATAIGHRKLLVIKRLAPSLRAYIQLMREKSLKR